MKHQQVVVDYFNMFKTSLIYLALAVAGYVLLRSIQAVFILPGQLKRNQIRLEQMAKHYQERLKQAELEESKKVNVDVDESVQREKEVDDEKKKEK